MCGNTYKGSKLHTGRRVPSSQLMVSITKILDSIVDLYCFPWQGWLRQSNVSPDMIKTSSTYIVLVQLAAHMKGLLVVHVTHRTLRVYVCLQNGKYMYMKIHQVVRRTFFKRH